MHPFTLFFLLVFLLAGTAMLTGVNNALRRLYLQDYSDLLFSKRFFYRPFHLFFFPDHEYEGLLCATISAQNLTRFFYAFVSLLFLQKTQLFSPQTDSEPSFVYDFTYLFIALNILGFVVAAFVIGEYLPRIIGAKAPKTVIRFAAPFSSIFMFLAFPITYFSLKLLKSQFHVISFEEPLSQTKREIIEIIQRARLSPELNLHEKKLIESVLRFKDRIAREIMVPRVDIFSLSANTSIREAAKLVQEEGYSRIPVYRNTVDNIEGVLMYKDVLNKFMEYKDKGNDPSVLEAPIDSIQKNVLYTPETKKISNLLLEFRKEQVHLAIVVDEYGGTEGIVTIEDILEEIVGDIEDEYDEEEDLFFPQSNGSWIVDARMSILDVEQELSIRIPQKGDYDTVGGYIFHCAGAIPSKGFLIHEEEFKMEILRSDERRVEKVRITPFTSNEKNEENKSSESTEGQQGKKE